MMLDPSLANNMKLLTIYKRLDFNRSQFFRHFSTAQKPPFNRLLFEKQRLYKKLSTLWSTGEKVSDVLDRLSSKGSKPLKKYDVIDCIMKFRKDGCYQQCFEILEWMDKGEIDYPNYALRLHIIYKVKGIEEAEKYFDSLRPDSKRRFTYGTLLHCYCSEKMTDKALALFKKMDEMSFAKNDMAYGNLMYLYMKVNQPEKVPALVEEMKRRNIRLSSLCYQIWVQSYASLNNLEGLERVMNEVHEQKSVKDDWNVYSTFASAYISAGKYEKADPSLKKIEQILDNSINPDSVAFCYLIGFYANVGDLESVCQTWDKLKSKFKVCNNRSYLTVLQALSKLGNIEGLRKCFDEWNSLYRSYDVRLPTVVIGAYLRYDMLDEAELLLKDAKSKAGQKIWAAHVSFMDYYLGKCNINFALRHLEVALANQWPWQPLAGKLDKFFYYFIDKKDVDGAEQFCQMLEKVQPLTSTTYLGLLKTYAAAGKTAPEMPQRMVQSGVEIGTEHEELLQKLQHQFQILNPKRWGLLGKVFSD
ncbi:hypothetical protein RDABS01_018025 [Bienertia sinuspersici]